MTLTGRVLLFRTAEKDTLVLVKVEDRLVLRPRGTGRGSTAKK